MGYGYGDTEGSMRFYHGIELSYPFGVNTGQRSYMLTNEAISFSQPIFHDKYNFPGPGAESIVTNIIRFRELSAQRILRLLSTMSFVIAAPISHICNLI